MSDKLPKELNPDEIQPFIEFLCAEIGDRPRVEHEYWVSMIVNRLGRFGVNVEKLRRALENREGRP